MISKIFSVFLIINLITEKIFYKNPNLKKIKNPSFFLEKKKKIKFLVEEKIKKNNFKSFNIQTNKKNSNNN